MGRVLAAALNGAKGTSTFSFGKDCSLEPGDQAWGRTRPGQAARVLTPVESLPGAEQTSSKAKSQRAAVYVLICLCYKVGFPLFETLVLLIK